MLTTLNLNDVKISVFEFVKDFLYCFRIVWMDFEFDATKRYRIHRHNGNRIFIFKKIRNPFKVQSVFEDCNLVRIVKNGNSDKVFQSNFFELFVRTQFDLWSRVVRIVKNGNGNKVFHLDSFYKDNEFAVSVFELIFV